MQKNEKCGDRTIWFSVDDIIKQKQDNEATLNDSRATVEGLTAF